MKVIFFPPGVVSIHTVAYTDSVSFTTRKGFAVFRTLLGTPREIPVGNLVDIKEV